MTSASTSATADVPPVVRAIMTGILDDASMFPPAAAPLEATLGLHAQVARSPWREVQGRLLLPASVLERLPDERALLGLEGPLQVGAVVGSPADPTPAAGLQQVREAAEALSHRDPAVTIASVEVRGEDVGATIEQARALGDHLRLDQIAVEVPVRGTTPDDIAAAVTRVAAAASDDPRIVAKVRCGAVDPAGVPTTDELAAFILTAATSGVPFKATAGLHHPDAIPAGGDRRHGYLNLLAAAHAAQAHGDDHRSTVVDLLERTVDDIAVTDLHLVVGTHRLSADDVRRTRWSGLRTFGTCSFTEPLAALLDLTSEHR